MARSRHRVEPVRRPLLRPLAAAGVAASLVVISLGLAGGSLRGTAEGAVQPVVVGPVASMADSAADARASAVALNARERAQVSRGQAGRGAARSTVAPTPGPGAPAAESSVPAAEPGVPAAEPGVPATEPGVPAEQPPPSDAVPEPPPVPVVVGQLWATTDVNIRSGPATGHERIGHLGAITQIDVTGAAENGWTQVVLDGRSGWVNSSYLSESKPEPQPEPQAPGVSSASCAMNPEIEPNLTASARTVYRAVCAAFAGPVSSFGGYRPGDDGDHGSGRAVDIMVSGEPGWEIARYVQAHAAEFGVAYVIYEQRIWQAGNPASEWTLMANRGSVTANHYDHVHVSVS